MNREYLVVSDPSICGGKPVIKGTRVPVQRILELHDRGYGVDYIHEQYPTVPKKTVQAVLELIQGNRLIKILY